MSQPLPLLTEPTSPATVSPKPILPAQSATSTATDTGTTRPCDQDTCTERGAADTPTPHASGRRGTAPLGKLVDCTGWIPIDDYLS